MYLNPLLISLGVSQKVKYSVLSSDFCFPLTPNGTSDVLTFPTYLANLNLCDKKDILVFGSHLDLSALEQK